MWLLDHNLPQQLVPLLKAQGIDCESTSNRGWEKLKNGELLSMAAANNFVCILTKDALFAESASKAIKIFPTMSIVLITIPQKKFKEYVQEFSTLWKKSPIVPAYGKMIHWPLN